MGKACATACATAVESSKDSRSLPLASLVPCPLDSYYPANYRVTGCNYYDDTITILQNHFTTMGQNHSLRVLFANSRHAQATRIHARNTPLTTHQSLSSRWYASVRIPPRVLSSKRPSSCPVCITRARVSPKTLRQSRRLTPEELPVRLAHRVRELDDLPQGLSGMPSIRRVKEWYAQSFEASMVTGRHSRLHDAHILRPMTSDRLCLTVSHDPDHFILCSSLLLVRAGTS